MSAGSDGLNMRRMPHGPGTRSMRAHRVLARGSAEGSVQVLAMEEAFAVGF